MIILAPNYCLEQSICNYLTSASFMSGSLLSGSNYTCYTGIDNIDLASTPAIIVDCSDSREVIPYSRNYEFNTRIYVKEMAADVIELGSLAGLIFNEFVNSNSASVNFSNLNYNINCWQVTTTAMTPATNGDALINIFEARIIGAPVPS